MDDKFPRLKYLRFPAPITTLRLEMGLHIETKRNWRYLVTEDGQVWRLVKLKQQVAPLDESDLPTV